MKSLHFSMQLQLMENDDFNFKKDTKVLYNSTVINVFNIMLAAYAEAIW